MMETATHSPAEEVATAIERARELVDERRAAGGYDEFYDGAVLRVCELLAAQSGADAIESAERDRWRANLQAHAAAQRMVRDAIDELFGPVASLESEEASLLRGPEPHHAAVGIIEALQRIRATLP